MQSLGKRTTMSYKMMSGGEGVCLECGAPFRGRSDKHFCSLSCKNAYHNRAQQTRRRHRSDILAVLTCNYGILEALLKEERVAVGPGNAFGSRGEGFVRCSYAASLKNIEEAMNRMERFVSKRK